MSFVHLQIKSAYSLLQSTITIDQLIANAKEHGFFALALTDKNVMYATIEFYEKCLKNGIKPIIGLTADILDETEEKSYPLVLLAENEEGYANLLKISSAIMTKSEAGLPRKWLKAYSNGLIAITPGMEGQIEQLLLQGEVEKAKEELQQLKDIFGVNHFYFSIQNHSYLEEQLNSQLITLSEEMQVAMVATNDVHYLSVDDALAQKSLVAINQNIKLEELTYSLQTDDYYLKSKEQMNQLFEMMPGVIENTNEIANRCNVFISLEGQHLPKYPLPDGETAPNMLEKISFQGLEKRQLLTKEYKKRLLYELSIIKRMQFSHYFLIVWDFIQFAKKQGILIGPGRGSAAGSLVSYCLGITDVDPIEHKLLFERFLNPERISMPDIDIDFPDNRRDEVITYVANKYGELHVAQIITFGTFAKKQAMRDIGRIMGLITKELEQLAKQVSDQDGSNLKELFNKSETFRQFLSQNKKFEEVYKLACKIEGLPRHHSTHAAGVVISSEPLVKFVPIQTGSADVHLTQLEMTALEKIGLLKMDFLGLRNLTIIDQIIKMIQFQKKDLIPINQLPLQDKQTFDLLASGETTGIFQLESSSARNILTTLKPTEFNDIVAVNALNRPGPMDNVPEFIKRKHKQVTFEYPHPSLQPILEDTYGIIVYQEQIMQIASTMGGFSLGQADLLRRAVSKKKRELLDEQRQAFLNGCMKKGYSPQVANEVYDLIVRFANYGFNRSHAVAYSKISYQLAYLKAHYPVEFMASLLTSASGNSDKIAQYIGECKKMGVEILPPSISKSQKSFVVENNQIRYSLAAIKGIGFVALQDIISRRKEAPFKNLKDFCSRVSSKAVNRKTIEVLIHAGCFDEWGKNRPTLLGQLDQEMEQVNIFGINDISLLEDNQLDELTLTIKAIELEDWSEQIKMEKEKEVFGFYLFTHPLKKYSSYMNALKANYLTNLKKNNKIVSSIVYMTEIKRIKTKKNDVMAFLKFTDETLEMDGVIFPNDYMKYFGNALEVDEIYHISGKVEERNGKEQFIIQSIIPIENAYKMYLQEPDVLYLRIIESNHYTEKMVQLKERLLKNSGSNEVKLFLEKQNKIETLNKKYNVNITPSLLLDLKHFLGEENVIVTK